MQDPVALLTTVAFVATVGAAGILDLRTRRIPNRLTVGSLLLALVLRAVGGLDSLSEGLMGAGLGLAVGLALFAVRALGGGDGSGATAYPPRGLWSGRWSTSCVASGTCWQRA